MVFSEGGGLVSMAGLILKHGGGVYAVNNICTHQYAELSNGFLLEGTITCPIHLSRFRLDTGEVLNPQPLNPCQPIRWW
jgi:nitrite reductase/ring-hydroxylating ferredoxin subunit